MAAGWNPVLVNQILDSVFSAAAFTAPAASYVQLHTGDPGGAGTADISSFGDRAGLGRGSVAGGSKGLSSAAAGAPLLGSPAGRVSDTSGPCHRRPGSRWRIR